MWPFGKKQDQQHKGQPAGQPVDMTFAKALNASAIEDGIVQARRLSVLTAANPENLHRTFDVELTPYAGRYRRVWYHQTPASEMPEAASAELDFDGGGWLQWEKGKRRAEGNFEREGEQWDVQCCGYIEQFIRGDLMKLDHWRGEVHLDIFPHLLKARLWLSIPSEEETPAFDELGMMNLGDEEHTVAIFSIDPVTTNVLADLKDPEQWSDQHLNTFQCRGDECFEESIGKIRVYSLPPDELDAWEKRYRAGQWLPFTDKE